MQYTQAQIENAKNRYNDFMQLRSLEYFRPNEVGYNVAEDRQDFHNKLVIAIANGDKALEREWKLFFLMDEVKMSQKAEESKSKLKANKEASQSVLEPIRAIRKLGEFYAWINTRGNQFRKEHFSKKYTVNSVNAFLAL